MARLRLGIPSTDSDTVSRLVDPATTVCGMVQKLDAINSPILYVFFSFNFLHKKTHRILVKKLNEKNYNDNNSYLQIENMLLNQQAGERVSDRHLLNKLFVLSDFYVKQIP